MTKEPRVPGSYIGPVRGTSVVSQSYSVGVSQRCGLSLPVLKHLVVIIVVIINPASKYTFSCIF